MQRLHRSEKTSSAIENQSLAFLITDYRFNQCICLMDIAIDISWRFPAPESSVLSLQCCQAFRLAGAESSSQPLYGNWRVVFLFHFL